jgi:hypothetical protein
MSKHPQIYTDADLALFAQYVAARADHRPAGCTGAEMCWVEKGPPGLDGRSTKCLGCGLTVGDGKQGRPRSASSRR